jgi:purine-nucleoside phosphorylase
VIEAEFSIPYSEIPNFPVSTVEGHKGRLILGTLNGKKVWVMEGRFHFYEGYTAEQVVFPIRVLKLLGVENLLLSNAAGGVNKAYEVGDLMIIKDHISFFTPNPLLGKNEPALGTRFPDMSAPYANVFIEKAKQIAAANKIKVHEGVYVGVTGPTFETRAEYQLIKISGGDVVGMSTVQENIAAVHCGMKVFAMSVVTDLGIREDNNVITHEEVLAAANAAEPLLTVIFSALVKEIAA